MTRKTLISLLVAVMMLATMLPVAMADDMVFTQSPYLDGIEGLPAVADRLPDAADVCIEDVGEIGKYGDSFTLAQDSSKWGPGKLTEEALFRFKTDGNVEPNVAKGYDVNEDATVYTIYLRKGMKWSDGVPFTSEDCRYFYEDLLLTGVTTKSVWPAVKAINPATGESEEAKFAVIDDYTFTMTFASSKPTFLQDLAINGKWFFAPKHWLQPILGDGTDDELIKKNALEMLGLERSDGKAVRNDLTYYYWLIKDRPTLRAWVTDGGFDNALSTWTRNPYFWKVDAEGKQLPYIDKVNFMRFSDPTHPLMWAMDGTIDVHSAAFTDLEVLYANQESAGYAINFWNTVSWSGQSLQLNQSVKDENLRALFQNINFRHALSIAVDREQIVGLIDDGFSSPSQSAPQEGQQGYDAEWVAKWTEFDPAGAEKLLAECGLTKKDNYYCFADGTQVVLNIEYQDANHANFAELLAAAFDKVGIKTTTRILDRSIIEERRSGNNLEATINWESFNTLNIALRADYLVPYKGDYTPWASGFGMWYEDSTQENAVEPTAEVKELLALYDKLQSTADMAARDAIALQMLELHKENVWEIGYTSPLQTIYVVNGKLVNFPAVSIACDEFRNLGIAHPSNWWLKD